ncbi:MAG: KilA-N domain-containing protein [Rikenellaceae bacterium]
MQNVQIFQYNNSPIAFQMGKENRMVNATQMAKKFNKRTNDWLATKHAKELIVSLSAKTGIPATGLILVNQGGNNQGTWMHEDIALIFAQWLSPDFYFWCNDRIKELMRFGLTATEEMLLKAATDPGFVLAMMEQVQISRQKSIELEQRNKSLQAKIDSDASKVAFYDSVVTIEEGAKRRKTFSVSQIARSLKLTPSALNRQLIKQGIINKIDGHIYVSEKYKDYGYTIERTTMTRRYNEDLDKFTMEDTKYVSYTPAGREYIIDLLSSKR